MAQVRKRPTQERSKRRYATILDAAARLFAELGFDGTTMEAIAKEAQTSIGSVYAFFPNKLAVFRAVADGCMERSRELTTVLVQSAPAGGGWRELVRHAIAGFAAYYEGDMGFRALVKNLQLYGEYAEADRALIDDLANISGGVIAAYAPDIPEPRRRRMGTIIVQLLTAVMFYDGDEPEQRAALLEEATVMIERFLAPELDS